MIPDIYGVQRRVKRPWPPTNDWLSMLCIWPLKGASKYYLKLTRAARLINHDPPPHTQPNSTLRSVCSKKIYIISLFVQWNFIPSFCFDYLMVSMYLFHYFKIIHVHCTLFILKNFYQNDGEYRLREHLKEHICIPNVSVR